MAEKTPNPTDPVSQRQRVLSKWETGEGVEPTLVQRGLPAAAQSAVAQLTQAELIHLRVRVIALENMVMALLAQASSQQLELARDMAAYILPREGFTQHPLTIHASHQMVDLVERAGHFRPPEPTPPARPATRS